MAHAHVRSGACWHGCVSRSARRSGSDWTTRPPTGHSIPTPAAPCESVRQVVPQCTPRPTQRLRCPRPGSIRVNINPALPCQGHDAPRPRHRIRPTPKIPGSPRTEPLGRRGAPHGVPHERAPTRPCVPRVRPSDHATDTGWPREPVCSRRTSLHPMPRHEQRSTAQRQPHIVVQVYPSCSRRPDRASSPHGPPAQQAADA